MNDKMLVSTIITTYKRTDLLNRAIESVLNQSYSNIEIIIVDDNDSDTSYRKEAESIVNKYSDNDRVKYIKHIQNMNGANARNTGIKAASGEFITFLDDDDYFLPDRFTVMIPLLMKSDEKTGLISSAYQFQENSKLSSTQHVMFSEETLINLLKTKLNIGSGSNFILKKKVVNEIGLFDIAFLRHQDFEYLTRIALQYKFITVDEPLLVVQVDSNQQNKISIKKLVETKKQFIEKYFNIIKQYNKDEIIKSHFEEVFKRIIKNKSYSEITPVLKDFIKRYSFLDLLKLFIHSSLEYISRK